MEASPSKQKTENRLRIEAALLRTLQYMRERNALPKSMSRRMDAAARKRLADKYGI